MRMLGLVGGGGRQDGAHHDPDLAGVRAADLMHRRQFTLGREELVAGDRLVLRTLRARARERQRWWLGLPLGAAGIALSLAAAVGPRALNRSTTAR